MYSASLTSCHGYVASTVETAEEYFNMDEYADVGKARKPTILITQGEIVQVHRSLLENLEELVSEARKRVNYESFAEDSFCQIGANEKDPLKQILDDLGAPPPQAGDDKNGASEISLALVNRFTSTEGMPPIFWALQAGVLICNHSR